jgi:hypothetical protein
MKKGISFLEKCYDDYIKAVADELYGNDIEGRVLDKIYASYMG